jgi:hypothetical protein
MLNPNNRRSVFFGTPAKAVFSKSSIILNFSCSDIFSSSNDKTPSAI